MLKGALSVNSKYCLAEMWLGQVYEGQNNTAESCKYFARFRDHCPDRPDAWQRDGICLANAGDKDGAGKAFQNCVDKSQNDDQKNRNRLLHARSLPHYSLQPIAFSRRRRPTPPP